MDQQLAISKARWDQTVEASLNRLGNKRHLVRMDLDSATIDLRLKALLSRTEKSGLGTAISSFQQFASLLQQFTTAINAMAQTDRTVSFVWGAVLAVLEIAKNFTSILNAVAEMLSELTVTLPRFESFTIIFPEAYELDEPLRQLYEVYVNCCITAILFLKSNRFIMLKNIFLPKIRKQFETATRDIQRHTENFNANVNLASARLSRQTYKTVADTHQQVLKLSRKVGGTLFLGVKFSPNPNFQGRGDVLQQLDQYVRRPGSNQPGNMTPDSCVIHGMGGVGKTQVALQYLYRHEKDYTHIFWVDSETIPNIVKSFDDFARVLMSEEVTNNQAHSVDLMRSWFMQNQSWLIIFDNVEDAGVSSYWSTCSHGSIIVTTQKMTISHIASAEIPLDGLSDYDGCEVILKHLYRQRTLERSEDDVNIAKKISSEVGGLPIILSHLAGFASHSRCTLMDLLELLQQPSAFKEIWAYDSRTSSTFQYRAPMSKLWGLALQELSSEAVQTLRILALLSPDGVPEAMLMGDWTDPEIAFLHPSRRVWFYRTRQNLTSRHLVEINNTMATCASFSIHRSLKSYMIQHMDESLGSYLLQQTFDATVEIVRRSFPPQSATQGPSNYNWNIWKEYLPHALSLRAFYELWKDKIKPSVTFATLLSDTGTYLWEIGLRSDSISIFQTGTEVCKGMEELEEIVPVYANICCWHGAVLAEIGLSGRMMARVPVERALQLRQRRMKDLAKSGSATRDDYLLLSNGWNDLGVLLMQHEEFEPATHCIQRGLSIKQQWITEEKFPQKFGESYKNLAYLLVYQHRNAEAVESAKKAYELMERGNGREAQATLKGGFVYGCILLATGDLQMAKTIHKDVLSRRRRLLGDNSFITKDSVYVLGEIYRLLGKPHKAEQLFREALREPEKANCGQEAIARAQYHLSLVLRNKQRDDGHAGNEWQEEATNLEQKILEYKKILAGPLTVEQLREDDIRVLDFVSSIWSGRPNLTGSHPFPVITLATTTNLLATSANESEGA